MIGEITFRSMDEVNEWKRLMGKDDVRIICIRSLKEADYERYAQQKYNVVYEDISEKRGRERCCPCAFR